MTTDEILALLNDCARWRFHRAFMERIGHPVVYEIGDADILSGVIYVE